MFEYTNLSNEDKISVINKRISDMEKNLYLLEIDKKEAEFRQDEKGLSAVSEEIEKCLEFLDVLKGIKESLWS